MLGKLNKCKIPIFCILLLVILIVYFFLHSTELTSSEKEKLGLQVVYDLYDFRDAYQLDANMTDLKECVTEEVFNDLTIDNEQRTLTTYLKFKNTSTSVNIIYSTDSYIYYSIENENISDTRRFIFLFNVNKSGKVDWYKEAESIEFLNTIY